MPLVQTAGAIDANAAARRTKALLKTGALQRAILDSANFSSIATDANGVVQIFNVGAERMLGYAASDVVNKLTPADLSDPDELITRAAALSTELDRRITPGFEALVFKAARGIEDIYELTYIRKDKSRLPALLSVTALRDSRGTIIGYLLIGTDNTARKHAEEKRVRVSQRVRQSLQDEVSVRTADLAASKRLYRSTFDTAPVGIVQIGLDGGWVRANKRLCALLGYSCEEFQTPAVRELMRAEELAGDAESLQAMIAGTLDRQTIDEKRFRRCDGSYLWARVNVSVHRDARGKAQHFISIIEDITEHRTLEAQVRQSSKMDAVGKLASGVAHDFNNLLTVILGYTEMMQVTSSGENAFELSEITKAAQSASALTRQLLAFSRQQVLRAEALNMNALISDMTGMLSRLIGEHIDVTLSLAPGLSSVLGDRGQLEQVVMNLVVNARDAMPNGGSVTIETAEVDLENSLFHHEAVTSGRYVMLGITDTGSGMTKETQRHLFEPFFTTKERGKGTGLGLSTTYGIVKQSKGYIWVYSEPGLGTTFRVYLPQSDREAAAPAAAPLLAVPIERGSRTVMLVEDEVGVRRLAKRILEDAGYHVLVASNGEDAESLFAASTNSIDLVVTDVVMPGGGGPALVGRLKAKDPTLRVLFMSGYAEQSTAHAAWMQRGVPFVQKPFTAAEFVRRVRGALDP